VRRLVKEHAPDDAQREFAERVVKHLERSGFELDEEARHSGSARHYRRTGCRAASSGLGSTVWWLQLPTGSIFPGCSSTRGEVALQLIAIYRTLPPPGRRFDYHA
jgi:hypothetical protein